MRLNPTLPRPAQMTIRRPDDWHLHIREGIFMQAVLGHTARQVGRAIIMPNLKTPVVNAKLALTYHAQILAALPKDGPGSRFKPLMTIYLTDKTTPEDIAAAKDCGVVVAAKLYPANATTNSANGVTNIKALGLVFQKMADVGLVLCVHGETLKSRRYGDKTRKNKVGQLRREAVFLKETLSWIVSEFPDLKVVLEHITTKEAVEFVLAANDNVAATITAHHLTIVLDDAIASHHNNCMPIAKEEEHRQALRKAATSGNKKFFVGTDSAPHAKSVKETACGCAGCYTALHAIELYFTVFEEEGALDKLEGFLSNFGADFYGLERNKDTITVQRKRWKIPQKLPYGPGESLVPFMAGKWLHWKLAA